MKRYEYILLEMSQTRQRAYDRIATLMPQLLVHLMNIEQFDNKTGDKSHWLKEVKAYRKVIQKNNQKKMTNKNWFSKEFIIDISEDEMPEAKLIFLKKWKEEFNKDYYSILDFEWFDLFE